MKEKDKAATYAAVRTLAEEQLAQIRPLVAQTVALLKQDPKWEQQFSDYAQEHGIAGGKSRDKVIVAQATLLGWLGLLQSHLAGNTGVGPGGKLRRGLGREVLLAQTHGHTDKQKTVLDRILYEVKDPISLELKPVATQLGQREQQEILGELFLQAVPQAERRKLGQFWTPEPIADFLAAWLEDAPGPLLDPAVGSGQLLFPLIARKVARGEKLSALRTHIFGNEISELVRTLLLLNLQLRYKVTWPGMRLEDFLTQHEEQKYGAIIANPPYTRHHQLSLEYKKQLRTQIKDTLGVELNGFTSLFAYFYLHSLSRLREGGKMAFITPGELFDASYAKPIQKYVLEQVNLRAVIYFSGDLVAFEGVDTGGVISLTQAGSCDGEPITFVKLLAWPGSNELHAALSAESQSYPWGQVYRKTRAELAKKKKWISSEDSHQTAEAGTVALAELAQVMRGVATGANEFFTLTESEKQRSKISEKYLLPVVCKARDARRLLFGESQWEELRAQEKKVWMFSCYLTPAQLEGTPEERYIKQAESEQLHTRSLVSKRKQWYQNEKRKAPGIFYTYMSRGRPRFILNQIGAQTLNAFLHILPVAELQDPVSVGALAAVLNATSVLKQIPGLGRSYGAGTVKIEPRELDQLRIPDLRTSTPQQRKVLYDLLVRLDSGEAGAQEALDRCVVQLTPTP